LAFNVLLVFFPAAGASYLAIYERKLLQAQEQSMVQQGRLLTAALSERGPLSQSVIEPILLRLEQRTSARIRVLDREGWLLADTSRLGPARIGEEDATTPNEGGRDPRSSVLYRLGSYLVRTASGLFGEPPAPVAADGYYSADTPFSGSEVRQALEGNYGAATRITPGGQRSVTLYSALPIYNEGKVDGAVLVSQSTFYILQDLYEVRLAIFQFLLGTVAVAAVLSLLVSTTISRPIKQLRAQSAAILDRRGRLKGQFGGSNRLDEIGDLSRALSQLSSRLDERMRFIESFAADVSHEFKNPLTSIRAAAEMLRDIDDREERSRFVAFVEKDITRLERLLSSVREITLLDADPDAGEDPQPVALDALVRGVVAAERFRDSGIETALPERPVTVEGNADRLTQVVENLVDNAVSFSPPGGRIRVSLEQSDGGAILRVEDQGPGVPPEHRDRVFDRFFSYRPAAANSREHSGLGLAIVKAIVERHRGSISLFDSPFGGAGFELRLPAR
ncbi:MAG TPA: ATP-binding protein, partial [Vicinamibacteria bacterium]|nr:ATP-binding protein [Vicinamibacteria bacterium]